MTQALEANTFKVHFLLFQIKRKGFVLFFKTFFLTPYTELLRTSTRLEENVNHVTKWMAKSTFLHKEEVKRQHNIKSLPK